MLAAPAGERRRRPEEVPAVPTHEEGERVRTALARIDIDDDEVRRAGRDRQVGRRRGRPPDGVAAHQAAMRAGSSVASRKP